MIKYCSETIDEIDKLKEKIIEQYSKQFEKEKNQFEIDKENFEREKNLFRNFKITKERLTFWLKIIGLIFGAFILYQIISCLCNPQPQPQQTQAFAEGLLIKII